MLPVRVRIDGKPNIAHPPPDELIWWCERRAHSNIGIERFQIECMIRYEDV